MASSERTRAAAPVKSRGLDARRLGAAAHPASVDALAARIERDGGSVLGVYRDPLGSHWQILAALPIDRVEPTPFQRDLSEAHVARLAEAIDRLDRFVDPVTAVPAADGIYWIPIDPHKSHTECASLIYDNSLSREERVYHLEEVGFPAQSPPSRVLHFVSNVEVIGRSERGLEVISNQIIHELRVGDFRQVGLGERRTFSAQVRFHLAVEPDGLRIAEKKIILLDRDISVGNMTMIL